MRERQNFHVHGMAQVGYIAIAAKCLLVLVGLGECGAQHCWNSVIRKSRLNWMAVPESDNIKNCKGCCCLAPVFIYLVTWYKDIRSKKYLTMIILCWGGKKQPQAFSVYAWWYVWHNLCHPDKVSQYCWTSTTHGIVWKGEKGPSNKVMWGDRAYRNLS